MRKSERLLGWALGLIAALSFLGYTPVNGQQVKKYTNKPEVIVRAEKAVVVEWLKNAMIDKNFIMRSYKGDKALEFYVSMLYQEQMFSSYQVQAEYRVIYNLANTHEGLLVVASMAGIKNPKSSEEALLQDWTKDEKECRNFQALLNEMKFDVENTNPGDIGIVTELTDARTIRTVKKGSAADKAGLKNGEVIWAVDGAELGSDPVENVAKLCCEAGTTHQFLVGKKKKKARTVSIVFEKMVVPAPGDKPGDPSAADA